MSLELPTVSDEIERKTRAHFIEILYRMERKELTPERALGAVDALWAVSSGLVPRDLMNLVGDAANRLRAMTGHE